jgi:DNA (cytosine-5)-methyltransferase 1
MHLPFEKELIVDNFAGGGGTSTGLEQAFGRPVDIAINHDPEALAMHAMNHPHTKHLCESVWDVNPIEVTGNQPVALVWLSPDCKHFSKAKGGTPVAKHIRGLAWVGMRWIALTKPRVLMLENVEEFQEWGPLIIDADGSARPDPAKKGKTFESFVRQLRGHGYTVDWRELRACDAGAPTIRKRLFLIARRDGLPIIWPEATHGAPTDKSVLAGKLLPWRTAAECIDFDLPAKSLFGRDRDLAENTQRRVAKGLWRHVLTSASPFIVGVGGRMGQSPARSVASPAQTITSKADSCLAQPVMTPFIADQSRPAEGRTSAANEPLRTACAEVKGGHFTVVAPSLAPLRGTSDGHMGGHSVEQPLSTVSAGGTHHGLTGAHLVTVGYGERPGQEARTHDVQTPLGTIVAGGVKQYVSQAHLTKFRSGSVGQSLDAPMPTITANSFVKRPGGAAPLGVVAAHLVDMGHGEGKDGTKRFSHGIRDIQTPLNTVTASGATSALAAVHLTHLSHHDNRSGYGVDEPVKTVTGANRGEQALVAACLEQANGGFYEGDGRPADAPMSTVTASGTQQRLITAYCVKYYSSGGQSSDLADPLHTLPTKGRMGLVQTEQVPAAFLAPEQADRARQCADLLHRFLPENFPEPAEMVLVFQQGQWWVLVDITLRMLKPRELFNAQGFPADYVIEEIPDPALLFKDGVQAAAPLSLPRKPLTATAQVRMCGNSVSPPQARALVAANFAHELEIYREAA